MSEQDSFTARDWLRLLATVAWLGIFMVWPRLTLGITFILVGGVIIAYNAMIFWETVITRGGGPSAVPLVGGVTVGMGILLLPIENAWHWAWIPLLLDWGGIPAMMAWMIKGIRARS
jgi:hypothetical protein